jgi:hypothetical protein
MRRVNLYPLKGKAAEVAKLLEKLPVPPDRQGAIAKEARNLAAHASKTGRYERLYTDPAFKFVGKEKALAALANVEKKAEALRKAFEKLPGDVIMALPTHAPDEEPDFDLLELLFSDIQIAKKRLEGYEKFPERPTLSNPYSNRPASTTELPSWETPEAQAWRAAQEALLKDADAALPEVQDR